MSGDTEDHLIEQPAIHRMGDELGWGTVNAWEEWAKGEVGLTGRL